VGETARSWIKDGLWSVALAGLVASIIRFASGLGTATGLNDAAAWGLWIAFKLVFVALAGGGFTLAGLVYVFHLESYRPILRRAILIALLGYASFIVSLIFDLGLPWHIYMPVISWQHHSVMFEIAWCVMLYFSVLILEFSPAILEHPWFARPWFQKILQLLHRLTLPLIISGIVLSTLHQSSLGSLFLIMPHRVHPLWYSPYIPYMFFTSAIAAGILALVLEAYLVKWWFDREVQLDLLSRLGKLAIFPLGLYLVIRLTDQWLRGVLPAALDGSWQSILYGAEILLGGILPIALLSQKRIRQTTEGLLTSAVLVILGIASQRMSLSMFTQFRPAGTAYTPTLSEALIAFAIPAAAILIYLFFAENLNIHEITDAAPASAVHPALPVRADLQPGRPSGIRAWVSHRSSQAVWIFALTFSILAFTNTSPAAPVRAARGFNALIIDGNQTGYVVNFPHLEHQDRLAQSVGEQDACLACHHLNLPQDQATACAECHADFYLSSSIFNHQLHQQALGGNQGCLDCHAGEHVRLTAELCQDCHESMTPAPGDAAFNMLAPSYYTAMHGKCLECHQQHQDQPDLVLCSTCHTQNSQEPDQLFASAPGN
jgi:Ni/Fe-hydrogenase subunit HybB-like protein